MNSTKVVVVGTGFRGFCDALHLIDRGYTDIHMIDSSPVFGGVMSSFRFDNFYVDNGVHIFDSIPKSLASVVTEIMCGCTHDIDFVSASAFNGKTTEGYSLPDLSSLEEPSVHNQILTELKELSEFYSHNRSASPKNLHELFSSRYGSTAGAIFSNIFKRVYNISAKDVEPDAIAQTSMGRLKFLDDDKMKSLKQDPWMDTVLAARRLSMGKIDDFVSIYPSDGNAMYGFCTKAQAWLEKKGVKITLGAKLEKIIQKSGKCEIYLSDRVISSDYLIWSNDSYSSLAKLLGMSQEYGKELQYGTPMIFMTFTTHSSNIKDFTYLQNFDPNQLTYRTAATGLFSNQILSDGTSFITSECPVDINSSHWENYSSIAPDVWDEIKSLGIVSNDAEFINFNSRRIPKTFKLAKVGYNNDFSSFKGELSDDYGAVIMRDVKPFFRRDIYFDTAHLDGIL